MMSTRVLSCLLLLLACGAAGRRSQVANYLVIYTKFLPLAERRSLSDSVGEKLSPNLFTIVERTSSSVEFPSDFDVIRMEESIFPLVRSEFMLHDSVKALHLDRKLTRQVKAFGPSNVYECEGRQRTKFSWENETETLARPGTARTLKRALPESSITTSLEADEIWRLGYSGQGVRVGIFDTGLRSGHPHFTNVASRTDWTGELSLDDAVGHGTFVAGVIASSAQCLGFAPDAELHIFRVFTSQQTSYTSWFLDALNYAIFTQINVINLSIGGPDFLDEPFVDKVNELIANNVILVSAIGNDGPLFGTLNNPADMNNVIGVGGITAENRMAQFSSRGMTLWEIPGGMGRFKPDIVTYSTNIRGSHFHHGCRSLSGTSVAAPVVAGIVTLLASVISMDARARLVTPASIKQVLMESAVRLDDDSSIFEQGQGRIDLPAAAALLMQYTPRASIIPSRFDTTDCPYMWPYCAQPLYYGSLPLVANLTVLNGMAPLGWLSKPMWYPDQGSENLIDISFEYAATLWPWSGYFVLRVTARSAAAHVKGVARGYVIFNVTSPPMAGNKVEQTSVVVLPVLINIAPTPPREFRLLWDQFHSLAYPGGFFPSDSLKAASDPLDWHGDHPYTNFKTAFTELRAKGYYIDVLGEPYTCFDARQYGALLIVDPEDYFLDEEIAKLTMDVEVHGLSVVVLADWFSQKSILKLKFFDDNTHSWWLPETGGCNTPGLNELLARWGITLADGSYSGNYVLGEQKGAFLSGSVLRSIPAGSTVVSALITDDSIDGAQAELLPILSFSERGAGRVAVYGDSSCVDDAARLPAGQRCDWLLEMMLQYVRDRVVPSALLAVATVIEADLVSPLPAPSNSADSSLYLYSHVMHNATHPSAAPVCLRVVWAAARAMDAGAEALVSVHLKRIANATSRSPHSDASRGDLVAMGTVAVLCLAFLLFAALLFFYRRST